MSFKFLEHTADVKILVEEPSLNRAFSTSALALKEVIAEQIKVAPRIKKEIHIESENKEALLYDFLEQFLYLFDTEGFILSKAPLVKIEKKGDKLSLSAKLIGDSASNYIVTNTGKAMTYSDMKIQEEKGKVTITFVLDV